MPASAIPERLQALRQHMAAHGVAACVVPSADPHQSEYLPAHWQARAWFSGFDGSAGTLVVTAGFAGLWTDSRYFSQAEEQLADSGVALMRLRVPHRDEHVDWLAAQDLGGKPVAVDGACLSLAAARRLRAALAGTGAALRTDLDLPGLAWPERPALPLAPVSAHPAEFAVSGADEKLAAVREAMQTAGANRHWLSALDAIAWLLNLRGRDVPCNPVFLAHLLIDPQRATLFIEAAKLDPALRGALTAIGVDIAPYEAIGQHLAALPAGTRLLLDPGQAAVTLTECLAATVEPIEAASPVTRLKAIKTPGELAHIRETMRQDGAALVKAFHRIERALAAGEAITELTVDAWLGQARAERPHFIGESFATIAGYMANGALPHYQATPARHARVQADGLLLVDSGGQYLGGTTDITRVWAFGATSAEQRHDATRVLQGMIALSRAHFPAGASGPQLDALARAPLWAAGLDYGHGTGHGVGYFLNVHEGPHGIRPPAPGAPLVALEPGMVTSIEPGVYKPGRHGVRHENLAVVCELEQTEFGTFLGFETLTLCPFDTRALEPCLLDDVERAWLNDYHRRVDAELAPLLEEADRAWLGKRCQPI